MADFSKRRTQPIEVVPVRGVCKLMSTVTACRAHSPVETFYCEEVPSVHSKDPGVTYRNDIYMTLNQRRLDQMTLSQFQDWLNHDRGPSMLSEVRSKMTDAQLHQFVKSRYIQHPAELEAWSAYLDMNWQSEVKKYQDSHKPAPADPAPADPAPSPTE